MNQPSNYTRRLVSMAVTPHLPYGAAVVVAALLVGGFTHQVVFVALAALAAATAVDTALGYLAGWTGVGRCEVCEHPPGDCQG